MSENVVLLSEGQALGGRPLSSLQVASFLARHPVVASRVAYHNAQTSMLCYPVRESPFYAIGYEWSRRNLGIPHWGLGVDDASIGPVVIFPDADCELHYSAISGPLAGPIIDAINEPPPDTIPHDRSMFDDLQTSVLWVAVGLVAIALARSK
jgi:hypothetical protein